MNTTWRDQEETSRKKRPSLNKDTETDIAIIGGGLCGVLSAYLLSKAGKEVVLIEKDELGSYATLDTTAFISQVLDTSFSEFESTVGQKLTKLIWQSGGEAINAVERIIKEEKIDCEFMRCSAYEYANTPGQFKHLKEEFETYKKLGFKSKLYGLNSMPFKNFGYMEIPNQAKFDPGKFLMSLAEKAEAKNAKIFEKTEALDIIEDKSVVIKTKKGKINANSVIIATYKPFINKKTNFKKGMYRSYVLELEIPNGIFPEAMFWDMDNPYHYFRVDKKNGKDRVIFGGEDHKELIKGVEAKSLRGLENILKNCSILIIKL